MRKKFLFQLMLVLFAAGLGLLAASPLQQPRLEASDWMAKLDDAAPLHTLSIPGTHDSGALHSLGDVSGRCQSLSIPEQLACGVRFLDIRLQLVDDELRIVHSFVDQRLPFCEVLTDIAAFLQAHPSEFLILSFKEDAAPQGSTVHFARALEEALLAYPDLVNPRHTLPETVGDARGRIHVIARYPDAKIGLSCWQGWQDSASFSLKGMYVQDRYQVKNSEEKIGDINRALDAAAALRHDLVLNYTSCIFTSGFPPLSAARPAPAVQHWLMQQLPAREGALGVVITDFITSDLAGIIIGRNFQ